MFVPATRREWFAKAAASAADAIIIDLEDAIPLSEKVTAREALRTADMPTGVLILRINGCGTPWHAADLLLAAERPFAAVMLPKAELPKDVRAVHVAVGASTPIIAMIETARGLQWATKLAAAAGVCRLAFGSVDFCADLECEATSEALLYARSSIVLASRLGGIAAPLDGITLSVSDEEQISIDSRRAAALGFSGKLCIHPNQAKAILQGFAPSPAEIARAEKIAIAPSRGASVIDGLMVDAPVHRRAQQVLERSQMIKSILHRSAGRDVERPHNCHE